MEEINKYTEKVLWMRNIDFKILRDLLLFIYSSHTPMRPMELEKQATEAGIFTKDGNVLNHTSRFNYRKTLEHLNLVHVEKGHYYWESSKYTQELLKHAILHKEISSEEANVFRNIIVENFDCRKYFFDLFCKEKNYSLEILQNNSTYVIANSRDQLLSKTKKKFRKIELSNTDGDKVELDSIDKIQAVFWGVRKWALDFQITDEIFITPQEGRIIYPIAPVSASKIVHAYLISEIEKNASKTNFWITIHIPSLIRQIVMSLCQRPSVVALKSALIEIVTQNTSVMMFIPTSSSVIESKIPFEKQDEAFRKCFLHSKATGYISHIKVHKSFGGFLL